MRVISEECANRLKKCGLSVKMIGYLDPPTSNVLDEMLHEYVDIPDNLSEQVKLLDLPSVIENDENIFTRSWGVKQHNGPYEAKIRHTDSQWWIVIGSQIPKEWPDFLHKPKYLKHKQLREAIFASDKVDKHNEECPYYTVLVDIPVGSARDCACAVAVGTIDSGREWTNRNGQDIVEWRKS